LETVINNQISSSLQHMSNVDRHKLKEDIRVKLDQHKDW